MPEYKVIAEITDYLHVVKYGEGDQAYGLLFAPGAVGTEQVLRYAAKNDQVAIFKGAMMGKEKGFF